MSPDEWLGIVAWLTEHNVHWTVDIATKYGVKLRGRDAGQVRQAMSSLLDSGLSVTAERVISELDSRPSKWADPIRQAHLRLYPNGCPSKWCDVCLDKHAPIRHNA